MLHFRTFLLTTLFLSVVSFGSLLANTEPGQPDCQCPTVTGVSATSSPLTATISWTPSLVFSGYIVQLFEGSTMLFQVIATGSSAMIQGTSPSKAYTAQVFGICDNGQALSSPGTFSFTSAGLPFPSPIPCGGGSSDIGGSPLSPVGISGTASDQIDFLNDSDGYAFYKYDNTSFSVDLSSMSNDYDLSVVGLGYNQSKSCFSSLSNNPGRNSESITINPIDLSTCAFPVRVEIYITPFGTAYNTHDCYDLTVGVAGFSGGGGEGELLIKTSSGLDVTPDAAGGNLTLSFDSAFESDDQVFVQVMSVDGQIVLSETTQALKGDHQIKLDMPDVLNGIYFVTTAGSFGKKSQKFVVTK